MNCVICGNELTSHRSKYLCGKCHKSKFIVKCVVCGKENNYTSNYFITLDLATYRCKQCKLKGEGNPNYNKRWSDEKKEIQSKLVKSKVDDEYRINCSKGMKGKLVKDNTKEKRKKTLMLKYGKIGTFTNKTHTNEAKKIIGKKSKEKFTKEYNKNIRSIFENNNTWIKLNELDDYILYRKLSNWIGNVLNENTVGIEKLKNGEFYNKNNRNKNSLVRDHMLGRKNGFNLGVFPEIIRHPANCQIISHSDNIKKSKTDNDSVINLDELFDRIKNWKLVYDENDVCISLINDYKMGFRYKKDNYIK